MSVDHTGGLDRQQASGRDSPRAARAGLIAIILVTALGVLAAGAWYRWRDRPGPDTAPAPDREPPPDDPRLTYAGPFRNVRPGIKYVGDAHCAGCHDTKIQSYREHPMGRSVFRVPGGADPPADPDHHTPF